jgi:hypothetical protein
MSVRPQSVKTMAELAAKYTVSPRRWNRYSLNTVVKVISVRNAVKQMIFGRTDNLCEGGLAFYSPQELSIDEQIQLEFELPSVKAPVKVVGVVRSTANGAYGVEFREMYARQRQDLVRAFEALTLIPARP